MNQCHSKLVVEHQWIVDWYLRSRPSDADTRQCGMVGLCEAALRFKPELGFAFSTYAIFWIRREVGRHRLHRSRWQNVSLSDDIFMAGCESYQPVVDLLLDIRRVLPVKLWIVFRMKYGRNMTETQIAEVMRCSRQWVNSLVQDGLKEIKTSVI